jgi:uncharacterized membrane-anchored protein YitT (DUF2179 family)
MPPKQAIYLTKSSRPEKKYMVLIDNKVIHFGATGYSDLTQHKNKSRKMNYEKRHRSRENWTKSGLKTAGFWSKWLLWNKPTLISSIKDIEKLFNVKIILQ